MGAMADAEITTRAERRRQRAMSFYYGTRRWKHQAWGVKTEQPQRDKIVNHHINQSQMMRQDRASTQTTGLTHNSSRSRRNRRVEGPHRHPRARRSWRHEYHLEQGRQRKQCLVVLGGLRWSLTALGVLVCLAWMRAEGRDNRLGSPRLGRHGLRGASLEQRWPTALEGGPCTCE